jgi:hypothetical protein
MSATALVSCLPEGLNGLTESGLGAAAARGCYNEQETVAGVAGG